MKNSSGLFPSRAMPMDGNTLIVSMAMGDLPRGAPGRSRRVMRSARIGPLLRVVAAAEPELDLELALDLALLPRDIQAEEIAGLYLAGRRCRRRGRLGKGRGRRGVEGHP